MASDDEDLDTFAEPLKCKCAAQSLNASGTTTPALSSSNLFEALLVGESLDDNEDGSFKSNLGSESGGDTSNTSSINMGLISNNEV